jgi:lipopolysaccharide export LptBFGC system permease protein LptF
MRIIDRYIGRQVLTATLIAVLILTIVMVLGNVFKPLLSLPSEILRDLPVTFFLKFMGYAVVASLPFTVPWSLLTAVLLVFGRLSADNELLALRMGGSSFARLCAPSLVLATLGTALCFWINLDLAPRAQAELARLPTRMTTANPQALLTPDTIVDQIDNFVIYIGEKKKDGQLSDFQMILLNESRQPTGFLSARRARLVENPAQQGLDLELADATVIMRDPERPGDREAGLNPLLRIRPPIQAGRITQTMTFQRLYDKLERVKPGMMTTGDLSQRLEAATVRARAEASTKKKSDKKSGASGRPALEHATELRTELNKRFSFSLACLAFVIIGLPLGVTAQRRETSIGFGLSLCLGIFYLSLLMLGDSILKDRASSYPWLIVWLPNVLFLILGGWLFWRLQRR